MKMSDCVEQPARTAGGALKKNLLFAAKILLAAGIIWWLIAANREKFLENLQLFNYYWLIPAGLAYASHMVVSAWRWYELAKVIRVRLSFPEALSLTMQAYFYSLVIPGGAIGGDVARVAALTLRSPKGAKAEGAFTVLMDRIIGMVALFVLAIVICLATLPMLMRVNLPIPDYTTTDGVRILLIVGLLALCLAGLAAMLVLFFHRPLSRIRPVGHLMQWGDAHTDGMVSRMTAALDLYRRRWKLLMGLTVVSIFFIHIMTVVAVGFIICGLGLFHFDYLAVLSAVTIGNIAGLIPLTMSGIGLRDVTICELLNAGGVEQGVVIPVMYTFLILIFNIFGGLFFIFDPGARTR
ncbi:lysylphosphatidylglycerol synthase transmembrane domain-containing protein [Victivallis sp. Marseille-Q1083]|uniref:lysylphosphatidylglycerol synthase transmembrane domain-containing protein n=1 Tax=Victivallis sp. Marseille-Q1083 TaxID=2717288 RepID=UPI00158DD5B9|nr:lysylphosphatidylglycerol synthase transmembrane domain-containing protein [Victivallis sp. Marseille-Q1083]